MKGSHCILLKQPVWCSGSWGSVHCSLLLTDRCRSGEIHLHRDLKVKGSVCTQELDEQGMAKTTQHLNSALCIAVSIIGTYR